MRQADSERLARKLHQETPSKIILVVADGLGGLPTSADGPTELEAAHVPYLDELARGGTTGLLHPVAPGITCGSGPGHLALFGYDPLEYRVGRGVLSALGVDFDLQPGDVAARGNFCTVDDKGVITDRRAGRISDEAGESLVEKLQQIELEGVEVFVSHVKQYRFTVVLRGGNLDGNLSDADPHETGVKPKRPEAANNKAELTADLFVRFIEHCRKILNDSDDGSAEEKRANMVLLRGFANRPEIPTLKNLYGLSATAVARYPMYRGLSRLLEMKVPGAPDDLAGQVKQLESVWGEHNFFFFHHKDTDSLGEDGNFDQKVASLEALDSQVPSLLKLEPDVLVVTGDHSTPSRLKRHSWHPVPVLMSAETCLPDRTECFGERESMSGGLGQFEARLLMMQMLAHANKLEKFGA